MVVVKNKQKIQCQHCKTRCSLKDLEEAFKVKRAVLKIVYMRNVSFSVKTSMFNNQVNHFLFRWGSVDICSRSTTME